MKICGIIAEFNPFHNGHKYLIEKARTLTNADYVIVVMSGDYVQRGEPAFINKRTRTRHALLGGADAVFMLPQALATSSADFFAKAGILLLSSLGASYIVFGSESGDIDFLSTQSYEKGNILKPNDTLALAYLNAINEYKLSITPYTIKRIGTDYNDSTSIHDNICSASYIRAHGNEFEIKNCIPTYAYSDFDNSVYPDMLSDILFSKLNTLDTNSLIKFADVFEDLGEKIFKYRNSFVTYTDYIKRLKSKDIAYSHISRALCHICLGITKEEMLYLRETAYTPYIRLLGFRKASEALLKTIATNTNLPILINLAKDEKKLDDKQKLVLKTDINSANLYSYLENRKTAPILNEYAQPIIVI